MFNTVNETVKFNHYPPRAIPARVWNSLETVGHKHLYLNAECVLCIFNESSFPDRTTRDKAILTTVHSGANYCSVFVSSYLRQFLFIWQKKSSS